MTSPKGGGGEATPSQMKPFCLQEGREEGKEETDGRRFSKEGVDLGGRLLSRKITGSHE